jgi:hypothetical protein
MEQFNQTTNVAISGNKSFRDIQVTYGNNIIQNDAIEIMSLKDVVENIRSNEEIKKAVQTIRNNKDASQKALLKKKLPFFVAAILRGYRAKNNFQSTEILIFDLDHLKDYEFDAIRKSLEEWEFTSVVFTSPSGNGLKLIIKINPVISSIDQYYKIYDQMLNFLNTKFNVEFDPHTKDPARACFLSYDEKIFVNEDAKAFDCSIFKEKSTTSITSSTRDNLLYSLSGVAEGERHNALLKAMSLLKNRGFDKDFIRHTVYGINQLNNPPFSQEEFDSEFNSIYNSLTNAEGTITFWEISSNKKDPKIIINPSKLIDFLNLHGFYKYNISREEITFVRVENNIISIISIADIKDFIQQYLNTIGDHYNKDDIKVQ